MDLVTLRAVRTDTSLWAGIEGVLKPGGQVILFTGTDQPVAEFIPPSFLVEGTQTVPFTRTQLTVVSKAR